MIEVSDKQHKEENTKFQASQRAEKKAAKNVDRTLKEKEKLAANKHV